LEDFDRPKSDWMKLVAGRFNLHDGGLRAVLPAGYERPDVRVVTEPHTDHKPVGRLRGPNLLRLLAEARELAEAGGGTLPPEVSEVPLDSAARQQFTVSQLTGKLERVDTLGILDNREESTGVAGNARDFGRLVHELLSRIDWKGKHDIAAWCELLGPQYVDIKDAARARELLERFATSARALELARARTLHREIEFLLSWPPGESNGEGRFFRGFIDCLYEDPRGGWHLIDYKTNNVSATELAGVVKQYEMQIGLYALATERALGLAPIEVALYFLVPGVDHPLRWDDAARRRTIDQVNQALTTDGLVTTLTGSFCPPTY
jgi:hypothetical protein